MIARHEIKVYGMMCQHCEKAVTKALEKLPGVGQVAASHENEVVALTLDDAKSRLNDLKTIIREKGYALTPQTAGTGAPDENPIPPPSAPPAADDTNEEAVPDATAFRDVAFNVQGMSCANGSLAIEKAFGRSEGIKATSINLPLEKGFVTYDSRFLDEAGAKVLTGQALKELLALNAETAQADIGIAIGSGTDVAKETGDAVLVKESLLDVERAIRLGKKTLKTMKLNFFFLPSVQTMLDIHPITFILHPP